jgi:hypothetical protein
MFQYYYFFIISQDYLYIYDGYFQDESLYC